MKDTITEFFFFSEEDLRDFHYDTHKFGGLRFFLELAVFLVVKPGIDNPKSCISFFRMYRKFLVKIEGLRAYDGYKYPASAMIIFLLFVRLCRFKTREDGLKFLERHKGRAMALGFNNGVPHELDVTKFVTKIGVGLDIYFVQLLRFIRKNVQIEGLKAFHIIGFLQHSNRFGENKDKDRDEIPELSEGKEAGKHPLGGNALDSGPTLWSWHHQYDRKYPDEEEDQGISKAPN